MEVFFKSESVKFSLIESVICLFTDSSEKKYFSLLNQSIFTEIISEIWLIHSNLFLAIWISQISLIISRFWLIQIQRVDYFWFKKWKKVQFEQNVSERFFSLSKPELVYLVLFSSSLSFVEFWKQIFMFFGRKRVESERSFLDKLTCFLKYHIPLMPLTSSPYFNLPLYTFSPTFFTTFIFLSLPSFLTLLEINTTI